MKCVIKHVNTEALIGPFETNAAAAEWAEQHMPMEKVDFEDVMAPHEFFPHLPPPVRGGTCPGCSGPLHDEKGSVGMLYGTLADGSTWHHECWKRKWAAPAVNKKRWLAF